MTRDARHSAEFSRREDSISQGVDGRGLMADHNGEVFAAFDTPFDAYRALHDAEAAVTRFFQSKPQKA